MTSQTQSGLVIDQPALKSHRCSETQPFMRRVGISVLIALLGLVTLLPLAHASSNPACTTIIDTITDPSATWTGGTIAQDEAYIVASGGHLTVTSQVLTIENNGCLFIEAGGQVTIDSGLVLRSTGRLLIEGSSQGVQLGIVTINAGSAMTNGGIVVVNGLLAVLGAIANDGTVSVGLGGQAQFQGSSAVNTGNLNVDGTLVAYRMVNKNWIVNNGVIEVEGPVENTGGTILNETGRVELEDTLKNWNGSTFENWSGTSFNIGTSGRLINEDSSTFETDGNLSNQGGIENSGIMTFDTGAQVESYRWFTNYVQLYNYGLFFVRDGELSNYGNSTIDNHDTIFIMGNAQLDNRRTFVNHASGFVGNFGESFNRYLFENHGSLYNGNPSPGFFQNDINGVMNLHPGSQLQNWQGSRFENSGSVYALGGVYNSDPNDWLGALPQ